MDAAEKHVSNTVLPKKSRRSTIMTSYHQQALWACVFTLGAILTLTASMCPVSTLEEESNEGIYCSVKPLLINLRGALNETFLGDEANNYTIAKWRLSADDYSNELDTACKVAVLDALGNNDDNMTEICRWLYYEATERISDCKQDLYNYCFKTSTTISSLRTFINDLVGYFRCR